MGTLHHTSTTSSPRTGLALWAALALSLFSVVPVFAQKTWNKYVFADVQPGTGRVHILLPPGRSLDPMLTFPDKSFFSCSINGLLYTNNDLATSPTTNRGQGYLLQNGKSYKINDTVRTIWTRDNVDIIQDVYTVELENGGQILLRWSFLNHKNTPVSVACQYLLDVDISDPSSFKPGEPNSNDGPIILHRYGYYRNWQQFIQNQAPGIPDHYMAFLYDLPQANPGLCAYGYLDNPAIGTIKPSRYTIGNWKEMDTLFWGVALWGVGTLSQPGLALTPGKIGGDIAELIEFSPVGAYQNKLVVAGATAYGTAKVPYCNGSLFAVLDYPNPIKWDKTTQTYSPNPFKYEIWAVNPQQVFDYQTGLAGIAAVNTFFTLTVGGNLNIIDTPPLFTFIGKSYRQPASGLGLTLQPGGVQPLTWYVKAAPEYFCQGDVFSEMKLTGSSSLGDSAFVGDTCGHGITVECAETDYDPPIDSVYTGVDILHKQIDVHDDRKTDRGLKSIVWAPLQGTDVSKFIIYYKDSIRPCASDKDIHQVFIEQLDSTIGGCFDFTFEDCLGHKSFLNVCMPAHPLIVYIDSLAPIIRIVTSTGSFDSSICNTRYDSIEVLDNRLHDRGLESVSVKPGTGINMTLKPNPVPITPGDLVSRVSVKVDDSLINGSICIVAVDTAKNSSELCLTYCTIADKLKPRIEVLRDNGNHLWNIKVHDDTAWDRKIDSVYVINTNNIAPVVIPPTRNQDVIYFTVSTADVTAPSGFCIYATDLYKNISDTTCYFVDAGLDTVKPNILYDPDPKTDPTSITVSINDIHYNPNLTRFKWDTGIDSVWFTDNFEDKMIVPPTIFGHCADSVLSFVLRVRDSLDIDSSACVVVNAVDCHGNLAQWNWCYPYPRDLNPPVLLAKYVDKQQIKIYVTDSTTYDRGNQIISTDKIVNLSTHTATVNKVPVDSFTLIRPLVNESSYATINTIDYWGSLLPTRIATHSAEIGIHVWIQDLAMKKGLIVRQAQQIELPVYFIANDTVALPEKSITDFSFKYTPTGDVTALQLLGIKTLGTASEGWTVTATPTGNSVLVEGHMPAGGSVLTKLPTSDTLLILQFRTKADAATRDVTLNIEPVNNETVVYNNGRDTIYSGLSSTAIMPPPWGSMSGARIVIAGSCAPSLGQNFGPTSTAILDIPTPNPAARTAALHYSIPADAFVRISVYDMLGREVKAIIKEEQKQGAYDVLLDVTELNNGQYVIRLEAGKENQMRTIVVSK